MNSTPPIERGEDRRSTNPKDAIGSVKLPLHLWPAEATALGCLGMLEGQAKYGRNNYVAGDGVILSIYVDATKRHLDAIMSGEDLSPDVLNFHFANALSSLAIPVKALAHGKLIDDRDHSPNGVPRHLTVKWPTTGYRDFIEFITPWVAKIKAQFKDKAPKHYTIADNPQTYADGGFVRMPPVVTTVVNIDVNPTKLDAARDMLLSTVNRMRGGERK